MLKISLIISVIFGQWYQPVRTEKNSIEQDLLGMCHPLKVVGLPRRVEVPHLNRNAEHQDLPQAITAGSL